MSINTELYLIFFQNDAGAHNSAYVAFTPHDLKQFNSEGITIRADDERIMVAIKGQSPTAADLERAKSNFRLRYGPNRWF
jgi:hypothetical protein